MHIINYYLLNICIGASHRVHGAVAFGGPRFNAGGAPARPPGPEDSAYPRLEHRPARSNAYQGGAFTRVTFDTPIQHRIEAYKMFDVWIR